MKYDDASWRYGGDFPSDLPHSAGATHTGMFVAWALLNGLAGEIHIEDFPEDLELLQDRSITPGAYFLQTCDGKFTDEDLNDTGNQFANDYFDFKNGSYLADYEGLLGAGCKTVYHIPDSWETFDALKPLLDQRFGEWQASSKNKS